MSSKPPQARVDKFFLAGRFVGYVNFELVISHDFEYEAKKPNNNSDEVNPNEIWTFTFDRNEQNLTKYEIGPRNEISPRNKIKSRNEIVSRN